MRLNRLEAKNYRLHSHLIVDFDELGSFTVTGSNGVGKSSFIEAIRYALKGKHRSSSGAGSNRIVKLGTTACTVTLDFSVLGSRYRVVRKRLTTGRGKGELELYQILDDGALHGLTEDNADATQRRLDLLVGIDDETLMATSYVAQGDAARFSGATPSGRKGVLRSVLRIEEFRPAAREARERERTHTVQAATLEREASGLEAAEADLADGQMVLRTAEAGLSAAKKRVSDAYSALGTAERTLTNVEARARQAAEAAGARARQVAQVERLEQDVARLSADVERFTAAADPTVRALGEDAARDLPTLEVQQSAAQARLVAATGRAGERRSQESGIAAIRARLDALRIDAAKPLPDLGEPLEVLEGRVADLPSVRTRLDAAMKADADRDTLARRLEELRARLETLTTRSAAERIDPQELARVEEAAGRLQESRGRLAALTGQVSDRAAVARRVTDLETVLVRLRRERDALPPPPADLEAVESLASGLDAASERRRAAAAAAADLDRAMAAAALVVSERREAAALAAHRVADAVRTIDAGARPGCEGASQWSAPDRREVDLYATCPLSFSNARLRQELPGLRAKAEDAEAAVGIARRETTRLGIEQADAAEALSEADAAVTEATKATQRLREIQQAGEARRRLDAEVDLNEGWVSAAAATLEELAEVPARHSQATTDVEEAQKAADRRDVLRSRQERVAAWDADAATVRAEVERLTAEIAAAGDTGRAWRLLLAERTAGDKAADTLNQHRTALATRERATADVTAASAELAEAEARLSALGDPAADVAKANAEIEATVAEVSRLRRAVLAGQTANEAESNRLRAANDLARAQAADADARQTLAGMPAVAGVAEELEAATLALADARNVLSGCDAEVERLGGEVRTVERRVSVNEAAVGVKRKASSAAEVEHRSAAAWARTAEVCELAPTLLMEQTIPVLEAEANAVLERVSSRGLRVRLETQRELTRDDGMAETLDIVVENDVGTLTYEDCSGGEQTRIDMALRIGLSRLLAGGRAVDFLIMDEGWGALDDEGVDALREVVAGLQLLYSTVILITHKGAIFDCLGRRLHVSAGPDGSVVTVM